MTKPSTRVVLHYACILALLLPFTGCAPDRKDAAREGRLIEDALGREVFVPDTVRSLITLRAGALRLVCYLEAEELVSHIEGNEKRRVVPYLLAKPELRELPVIGMGNNADPELLAAANADLIVVTFYSPAEADALQERSGTPVFALDYGDFAEHREVFYESLRLLGNVVHKRERADSLIGFIEHTLCFLQGRLKDIARFPTAYIGGVAYRGAHGITSTQPAYPPFHILGIRNTAANLGEVISSPLMNQENAFIDPEQLILWDPEYLFLDAAGEPVWSQELHEGIFRSSLQSLRHKKTYTVLPYNWYTTNYENILCNSWFLAKTVFPTRFEDISTEAQCREIFTFFLGEDVFPMMKEIYRPYRAVEP